MMEAELIQKGLWTDLVEIAIDANNKTDDVVAAKIAAKMLKRKPEKMAQARAKMILCVEPGQLAHMTTKDPMEI